MSSLLSKTRNFALNNAEFKAAEILNEYSRRTYYPVDVIRMARGLGIDIYSADYKSDAISGRIKRNGFQFSICYNRKRDYNHVRLLVAHEIGHYVLGHLDNVDKITDLQLDLYRRNENFDSDEYQKEVEANKFAIALLTPEEIVVKLWNMTDGDLTEIARRLEVPVSFLGYRFDYLDTRLLKT